MLADIKLAFQLMKPELKVSVGSFIGKFLFYSLYAFLFIFVFHNTDGRLAGMDIFFLLLFVFGPTWFKPKHIQYQKIGSTYASPTIVMGLHLPIKKKIVVLKSVLVYLLSSVPFQLYFFIVFYVGSSAIRESMALSEYLSFVIIWLSFGIYVGLMGVYAEAGTNEKVTSWVSILSFAMLILIAVFIIAFPFFFDYGIVELSIILAKNWGLLAVTISIIAAVIGFNYWKNKMLNYMKKMDYL